MATDDNRTSSRGRSNSDRGSDRSRTSSGRDGSSSRSRQPERSASGRSGQSGRSSSQASSRSSSGRSNGSSVRRDGDSRGERSRRQYDDRRGDNRSSANRERRYSSERRRDDYDDRSGRDAVIRKRAEAERRRIEKQKRTQKLAIIWSVFAAVVLIAVILLVVNKDKLAKNFGSSSKIGFEKSEDPAITGLVEDYFNALKTCDQNTLKSLVTEPASFDDMTVYEGRAEVISDYTNILCYTVDGYEKNEKIVYAVFNIKINGVESTPLDIMQFYLVEETGKYKINNGALPNKTKNYVVKVDESESVQKLYTMVKEDNESLLASDPTFAEFYNKLQ